MASTILTSCNYCGNKGNLDVLYYDESVDIDGSSRIMLKCPVCRSVSLASKYPFDDLQVDILYPNDDINLYGVPINIKTAFESAIKTKHIDISVCALALRRCLEMICKEQGAKKKTLEMKIDELTALNILPKNLKLASDWIRKIGNAGAHGDNDVCNIFDVHRLTKFVEAIINYIYVIPAQILNIEKSIKRRQSKMQEVKDLLG